MTNPTITRQPYWLNKKRMAESLGISVQAFDKWGVEPVAKIGRESFYDTRSVLDNRLQHQSGKQQLGGDDIDPLAEAKLLQERLRLTREQADSQAMRNEVKRRNLVPVGFMTFAITRFANLVGSGLDTIHTKVKRKHPDIEPRHLEAVQREVAVTRNEVANLHERLPEIHDEYISTLDDESG
ncbi:MULTISPECIES: terminase small subunit [Pseudomonas]|uniref:terminase small subunit n=1 Tax=Pseudomonas TaxID=286 RepID=UPI000B1E85CD|nr:MULTISPECIES: terminase small subunit [Pseudomonas]MDG9891217.1 terminase small subunit [Pseudomonas juntendi]